MVTRKVTREPAANRYRITVTCEVWVEAETRNDAEVEVEEAFEGFISGGGARGHFLPFKPGDGCVISSRCRKV